MLHLIVWFLSQFCPPTDAEALRRTAPTYLTTTEQAAYHVTAATIAAGLYDVDTDLVLSIAHHESRYTNARNPREPGGLTSCGVMTPIPKRRCVSASIPEGYIEGAAHLRGWIDGPGSGCRGNIRCALLGFAGGHRLIRACARGPVHRTRGGHTYDACDEVVYNFRSRANWIRKLRNSYVSKRSGV